MTPAIQFKVGDRVTEALRRLVASRESRDGTASAMNMSMQYWVSFIMHKQTVAPKGGIRGYLMQRAAHAKGGAPKMIRTNSGRESTAKRYQELRASRAAAIVYSSNYKNARSLGAKEFYSLVGKYVARRQYSSGHHKAGFRPALSEFKIRRGLLGVAPGYRRVSSSALAARSVSESIMEALVHNASAGAAKNPTGGEAAVLQSEGEVVDMLAKFIVKNLRERARGLGLGAR